MYRVVFVNQGKVYEVYVKHVSQPDLYGFVEIGGFTFGEGSRIVIDPVEKQLQEEFGGVQRSFIPMHAVIRIDEVAARGQAKITEGQAAGSNVTPFPLYTGPRTHQPG